MADVVMPRLSDTMEEGTIHIGPSDYVPFLQDILHRLEVGGGSRFFRVGLAVLAVVLLTVGYNWRAFRNMATQEAMDTAQVARNIAQGKGCLQIETPDSELDNFVNHWLPRQIFYHGDVNRLTTDPQTRNYIWEYIEDLKPAGAPAAAPAGTAPAAGGKS